MFTPEEITAIKMGFMIQVGKTLNAMIVTGLVPEKSRGRIGAVLMDELNIREEMEVSQEEMPSAIWYDGDDKPDLDLDR